MLDPQDRAVFDGMVSRLRADDPAFHRRTSWRRPLRLTLGVLLWILAPIAVIYGGWTGLAFALAAGTYGLWLLRMPKIALREARP